MIGDAEQQREIYDTLKQMADFMKVPILKIELENMAKRLAKYHGLELFRYLNSIPDNEKYFPSGLEIEAKVRAAMGKPPGKGLNAEIIEKNKAELIASGQKPELAEAGAAIMRKAAKGTPPAMEEKIEIVPNVFDGLIDF